MAVFIPDVKPEDFNNSPGEKEVYEALKLLGKDYTVFYSLSWISIGNDRTIGEADFILFHPVHGIMVIEVKSGEIEYKGENGFKRIGIPAKRRRYLRMSRRERANMRSLTAL